MKHEMHNTRPKITGVRSLVRQITAIAATGATVASLALPSVTAAQMVGVPLLQNAFTNPGLTVGGNFAKATDATTFAFAAAFAPGAGRVQVSAGGGTISNAGNHSGTYGARAAFSLKQFAGGTVGIAPFGGFGFTTDPDARVAVVALGAGVGFRHALGATRAFSAYATPFYALNRQNVSGAGSVKGNLFRVSLGLDVALLRSVGATVGIETGAKAAKDEAGATSSIFGVGLSYAF